MTGFFNQRAGKVRSLSRQRIVIGNSSLAKYPEGGGVWTWLLQYMLGFYALGHDVFWFELLLSTADWQRDAARTKTFFERFEQYGLRDRCVLLFFAPGTTEIDLTTAQPLGMIEREVREICDSADLLLNMSCAFRSPLLFRFRHRVHVGGDPGHLQIGALTCREDLGIYDHHVLFTDGLRLHSPDCQVPTLGLRWHTSPHPVYLPLWKVAPDPGRAAPFTSITQWWNSGELQHEGRVLSISKRDGYLRYLELPQRTGRSFQLAVDLDLRSEDGRSDFALLTRHGWEVIDPRHETGSMASYQGYIRRSRAEFGCAKPVYRELKTGWFSERSACYLALGRPVVVEDTGFSDILPTGDGILAFTSPEQAAAAVHEIDANYRRHAAAARAIAREYFDSDKVLSRLIEVSMNSQCS